MEDWLRPWLHVHTYGAGRVLTLTLTALILLAGSALHFQAQEADSPASILQNLEHVEFADGIDEQGFVSIGGIQQWISVRGRHKNASILLFLHGGPGLSSIPTSWYFLSPWEEYFTLAHAARLNFAQRKRHIGPRRYHGYDVLTLFACHRHSSLQPTWNAPNAVPNSMRARRRNTA